MASVVEISIFQNQMGQNAASLNQAATLLISRGKSIDRAHQLHFRKQHCCGGDLLDSRKFGCCDNKSYEMRSQFCCGSEIRLRSEAERCCISTLGWVTKYDPKKMQCCKGSVGLAGLTCCGGSFLGDNDVVTLFSRFLDNIFRDAAIKA